MKTTLKEQGFTVLAYTTNHQLNYKKIKRLKEMGVICRTRATKNFITEYYTMNEQDADILYKIATNQI